MKYRTKPVVIEAVQLKTGREGWKEVESFTEGFAWPCIEGGMYISAPDGEDVLRFNVGDYIVKGVKGDFYPCEQETFEATHEAV